MSDLTFQENDVFKYLYLCIIQSPAGILFYQMQHIHDSILCNYFKGMDHATILFNLTPFPVDSKFDLLLFKLTLL